MNGAITKKICTLQIRVLLSLARMSLRSRCTVSLLGAALLPVRIIPIVLFIHNFVIL